MTPDETERVFQQMGATLGQIFQLETAALRELGAAAAHLTRRLCSLPLAARVRAGPVGQAARNGEGWDLS